MNKKENDDSLNSNSDYSIGVGVDIVDIKRIERLVRKWDQRFLHKVFRNAEIADCKNKYPSLAARFAAKEAVYKAFGVKRSTGISWKDLEVISSDSGAPVIKLHDKAEELAQAQRWESSSLSLSHDAGIALAFFSVIKKQDTER